jgi:hypothetical protein
VHRRLLRHSEMAAVEMALQRFDGKRPLMYTVQADCFPGRFVIVMKVQLNGTEIYQL